MRDSISLGHPMMTRRHFFSRALTTAVATGQVIATQAQARKLDLQGHRGARGLAPENTLPAFMQALDLDVTTLELDIGLSKDDVVVISHDPTLNPDLVRGEDKQWITERLSLRSMTYEKIARYDVGRIKPGTRYAETFAKQQAMDSTGMPTLDTLFEMVRQRGKEKVRFNIETKLSPLRPEETASPEQMVRAVLAVIDKHQLASRCNLQSFDWRTLQISQRLAPQIPTAYLTIQQGQLNNVGQAVGGQASAWTAGFSTEAGETLPGLIKRAGGAIWSPFWRDLSQALIVNAQSMGLQVIPWTVNDPQEMQRLISWGVDGIITDYPNLLRT